MEMNNERMKAKMNAFQEKVDDGQEGIKDQVRCLASRIDAKQEGIKTILYRTIGLMDFIHRPVYKSRKQKNTTFRRLDLSPSSGVWDKIKPTQLGPIEGAGLNHWTNLVLSVLQ
jgi:hypothetical protein